MTTSFNYTKSQIISEVLKDLNIISENQVPSSEQYNHASNKLNIMIKKWEAIPGINIWKRKQAYLFPALTVPNYTLGLSGDHCTNSYINTTVTYASSTTLVVSSITGMSSGDFIGIKLDAGSRQWTTINGTPTGSTITLTTPVASSATTGNSVITYTSKINRPLSIIRGTIKNIITGSETMFDPVGYDEYYDMPIKTTPGRPNNIYYDKNLGGSNPYTGTLYTYPVTNNVDEILVFTYQDPLSDAINTTDYLDFPPEWISAIVSGLRCEICPRYGKFTELQQFRPIADVEFQLMKNFDADDSSISFGF